MNDGYRKQCGSQIFQKTRHAPTFLNLKSQARIVAWSYSRYYLFACARMKAAPCWAIMMEGELVLPDVMLGMMEASITRSPSTPYTRNCGSTTAIASTPILQVPTGWKMVVPISPAARSRSAWVSTCEPGLYSFGLYCARAGWAMILRVNL